jgi:3-dehydroquinate dehydratase-2
MSKPIYVLNGPNLNRLGTREPHIYGTTTLKDVEAMCRAEAGTQPIEFRQTNSETQLIDWVHAKGYAAAVRAMRELLA